MEYSRNEKTQSLIAEFKIAFNLSRTHYVRLLRIIISPGNGNSNIE